LRGTYKPSHNLLLSGVRASALTKSHMKRGALAPEVHLRRVMQWLIALARGNSRKVAWDMRWLIASSLFLMCLGPLQAASQRLPGEPGASRGVVLQDISKNGPKFSSAFPAVSVDPVNDQTVAVAWRVYSLPINTNALKGSRVAECHVSLSTDGGKTFTDFNLMRELRTALNGESNLELWYCNAPWVTFGPDGTIYAGGSLFTANGVTGPQPKQGRTMVTVSTDNGATWKSGVPGITIARLAPGLTGLRGGNAPQDTPWDGSMGLADPRTGVLYSIAGLYVAASHDKGKTFGRVYQPDAPGWVPLRGGSFAAAFGTLAVVETMKSTPMPGVSCPCLAFGESNDEGEHWHYRLVSSAGEVSPGDRSHIRVRYPPIAADRMRRGHFAIAAITADGGAVRVFSTEDDGHTWRSAAPNPPPAGAIPINTVGMPGIAYTPEGGILVAWRGFRSAGAYDTYLAMVSSGKFGPTLKLNNDPSEYPPLVQAGNYSFGGGDYTTGISSSKQTAYVVFPYSPFGVAQRTVVASVNMALLK
jgi:hypothetical protein